MAFGSPGLGTSDIDDLKVDDVYVIEAKNDAIADLGYFGTDTNQLGG